MQDANKMLELAENIAITHNEGLDFIFKKLKDDLLLKSASSDEINSKITDIAINYIESNEEVLKSRFSLTLKSSTVHTSDEIHKIINSFNSYRELEELMDIKALKYVKEAEKYLSNTEINLDSLLYKIVFDDEFKEDEKLALCGFIKTLVYSKTYWDNNNWKELGMKNTLKSYTLEKVVLMDCYFLWWGTLSGGPIVGAGAGAVASAVSGL